MHRQRRHPHRFSALVRWALVWSLVVGTWLQPAIVQATVTQAPLQQDCTRTGPQYIFQNCVFPDIVADILEANAISQLLERHGLPPSDAERLVTWERNLIRAALFDRILGMIHNPAQDVSNSVFESMVRSWFADAVKQRRVAAAEMALNEYNRWERDPCSYQSPAGFSPTEMCSAFATIYYGGPKPPSFEEFQAYGLAYQYSEFETNTALIEATGATVQAVEAIKAYAFVTGVSGGTLVGSVIGSMLGAHHPIIKGIYPYFPRILDKIAANSELAANFPKIGTAVVRGATTIGFVVTMIIGTIITAVFEGIEVAENAQIPVKLQEAVNTARNTTPNLQQMITTEEGVRELYAVFMLMTMPDYPANAALPGPESAEVDFRYFTATGSPTTQPGDGRFLHYQDWLGRNHTAWLTDGWFTDQYTDSNGVVHRRLTLKIEYVNPTDEGWVAWRAGDQFIHTRAGADVMPFGGNLINYKTHDGSIIAAEMILPPPVLPEAQMLIFGALNEGETVIFSGHHNPIVVVGQPVYPSIFAWTFPPDTTRTVSDYVERTFTQSGPIELQLERLELVNPNQPPQLAAITHRTLMVNNVAPQVQKPTITPQGDIQEGQEVTAVTTFTDVVDDAPYTCAAHFGDSNELVPGTISGNTCTVRHRYIRKGEYRVTIEVNDKDGGVGVSEESDPITIVPSPPTITFLTLGRDPETGRVYVEGVFTDMDLEQHSLEVDWGDGQGVSGWATLPEQQRNFRIDKNLMYGSLVGNRISVKLFDRDGLSDTKYIYTSPPLITSEELATFAAELDNTFTFAATGSPPPSFEIIQGTLPPGVMLTNLGDGTATLTGKPEASAGGSYAFTVRAHNSTTPPALQDFVLTINAELGFTSPSQATFVAEKNDGFMITTSGFPRPSDIRLSGTLPEGLFFVNYTTGEALIGGTPAVGSEGVYPLQVTIVDPSSQAVLVQQDLTLTVNNTYQFISLRNHAMLDESKEMPFQIRVIGTPRVQLTMEGRLPEGVTFVDNGDGTGTLGGVPVYRTMGIYPLRFYAWHNDEIVAQQEFQLEVLGTRPPEITIDTGGYITDTWRNELLMTTFLMRNYSRLSCSSTPNPTMAWVYRAADGTNDHICRFEFLFDTEGIHPAVSVRASGIDTGKISTASFGPVRIDLSQPETTLAGMTVDADNRTASFSFSGSDALSGVAGFECSLNLSTFTACTSPHEFTNLATSTYTYTFRVRAVDQAGNVDSTPASYTWSTSETGSNSAPIANAGGPYAAGEGSSITLDASATTDTEQEITTLTYEWDFDNDGQYTDASGMTPTFSAAALDGPITVTVGLRVIDDGGLSSTSSAQITVNNSDPMIAEVRNDGPILIDSSTQITVTASDPAGDVDPLSYEFDCDNDGVFEVTSQAEPTTSCPFTSIGAFTVTVQVKDDDGGMATGSTVVTVIPLPDTMEPDTVLDTVPDNPSDSSEARFTFSGSDDVTAAEALTFECQLNTDDFTSCTSPQDYSGLVNGEYTFRVRAIDGAGNVDSTPASHTWIINAAPVGEWIGECGGYQVYLYEGEYQARGWEGNILVGTELQDNLTGGVGNDLILGLGGNDILNGKAGDDVICGGEGNDLIYGELGTDHLDGGNHNDVLNGGTGDFDVLLGGEGNDTLLDPDGVADLQGGPGNDQINLSLHANWRSDTGDSRFVKRFAAGLGNDTVTFGILGNDAFTVDITGDEWTDQAGEGTADTIRFAGRIEPASSFFHKFEGQVIIATSELPLITDETGYEYWVDEPVEESPNEEEPNEEEPTPQPPIAAPLDQQLYLPIIKG